MKREYNIVFIDTQDSSDLLRVLNDYGNSGWKLVTILDLVKESETLPHLKRGVFERPYE